MVAGETVSLVFPIESPFSRGVSQVEGKNDTGGKTKLFPEGPDNKRFVIQP